MTAAVDKLAAQFECGCDYCGARTGLERYESSRTMDNGFRCIDPVGCDERDRAAEAAWEADGDV